MDCYEQEIEGEDDNNNYLNESNSQNEEETLEFTDFESDNNGEGMISNEDNNDYNDGEISTEENNVSIDNQEDEEEEEDGDMGSSHSPPPSGEEQNKKVTYSTLLDTIKKRSAGVRRLKTTGFEIEVRVNEILVKSADMCTPKVAQVLEKAKTELGNKLMMKNMEKDAEINDQMMEIFEKYTKGRMQNDNNSKIN